MTKQEKAPEKKRRDWWIILIILLFGFLCVILAGGWAIRFAPTWKLGTNMRSNIDPNSDFLTSRPDYYIEPLDPSILTQPAWINVFLTPGASFETAIPVTALPTNIPPATNTPRPTAINSPTAIIPNPTNTLPYYPLPTNTSKPPPPPATNSPVPATNSPVPALSADLAVTKDDGVPSVNTGSNTTYTVRVTNNGPDTVTGAILTDLAATGLTKTVTVCSPTPGQCAAPPTIAQLEGGSFALPTLTNGQFYEITITANVTAVSGSVTNTAAVTVPAGVSDPNMGNNSAADINVLSSNADLWIEITDNATNYTANTTKLFPNIPPYAYTITVHNAGPSDVTGATVSNVITNGNANSTGWVCNPSAGSTCGALLGAGNLNNAVVNLNSGASVTFYLAAQVIVNPSGPLANIATVTAPLGVVDPSGNNSATDSDTLLVATNFPPDLGMGPAPTGPPYQGLSDGQTLTLNLPTPLSVGSHPGWDLIYFEELNNGGIDLDWVTLQIGDGSNWYTVLNWGNGISDSNTNIAIPLVGNSGGNCNGEPDNCHIDGSLLSVASGYNTGVAIDVDGLGIPSGSYPYLRVIASTGSGIGDGGVLIDGIYVIP